LNFYGLDDGNQGKTAITGEYEQTVAEMCFSGFKWDAWKKQQRIRKYRRMERKRLYHNYDKVFSEIIFD
jgi:hypothetical protein